MHRLLIFLLWFSLPTHAQLVAGPWVDRAEARIEEHRMADVEVLVLDEGDRPVSGAEVTITQRRHAFPFGVVLPEETPGLIKRIGDPDRPLWRGLSAVSLAEFSGWPVREELDALLEVASQRGLWVRLGAVAPGDPVNRPNQAVDVGPEERLAAALARLEEAAPRGRFHALDLVSSAVSHPWLTLPQTRRLGQAARAAFAPVDAGGTGPPLWLGLGCDGALELDHGGAVLTAAEPLLRGFVPADGITTPLRITRPTPPEDLERALQRLEVFDADAAVAPVSVALDEADQPFTLEAALILLFAEPRVREVHLGALDTLLDSAGNPTAGGEAVDFLLAERWWTRETATTDALGIARFRVFAGKHAVEAGSAEVVFAVEAGASVRVVVADTAAPGKPGRKKERE